AQMRKQPALVRIAFNPVSRTRCLTNSQTRSPSAGAQQSGPMQRKRCRSALATPALANPAWMASFIVAQASGADPTRQPAESNAAPEDGFFASPVTAALPGPFQS